MISSSVAPADLADAIRQQAVQAGAATPSMRGADWRQAIVQTVNGDGTVLTTDGITARRLDSYQSAVAGERIVVSISGAGNWIALGRTAGATEMPWATFTPTWTVSSGTNPSLGNGTLAGRYWRHGSHITGTINLTIGSTTSLGSGNYFWQLPTNISSSGLIGACAAQILTAAGPRWGGQGVVSSTDTNRIGAYMPNTAGDCSLIRTSASKASPSGAFVSGDQLRLTFQYEAA
ncbi:hypothetical protein ACFWMG_04560 [Streptomyces sp. NPDC127074]|uniref:hypothetical protein n=1 Tax=Streptomyces sp. NPDC127074 TaxID=3347130 RepID=UPI003656BF12